MKISDAQKVLFVSIVLISSSKQVSWSSNPTYYGNYFQIRPTYDLNGVDTPDPYLQQDSKFQYVRDDDSAIYRDNLIIGTHYIGTMYGHYTSIP